MIGHYENVKACSHLNVISIENKLIDLKLLIAHFVNITCVTESKREESFLTL